jgi:3',5'-cyclic-nucleotide phosphodiesterase
MVLTTKLKAFTGILFLYLWAMQISGQNSFDIVALGTGGGVDESNISSYLVSASNQDRYIALDAGTLMHGLQLAVDQGHFDHLSDVEWETAANVLLNHIDAYCISHPHLDHIVGMMMAAPFDNQKTIFGSEKTIDALLKHVFLSPLWGNFTTEDNPNGKWELQRMREKEWYSIPNNSLEIKYYKLHHAYPNESGAFLVKNNENYLLYFGDTGADRIENSNQLEQIYKDIAPLIQQHKMKAIFMEISFPNKQNNQQLYGHLKPHLMEEELKKLSECVNAKNPDQALYGIPLFITHIKPDFKKKNKTPGIIEKEIQMMNTFGAETIIIKQSSKYKI